MKRKLIATGLLCCCLTACAPQDEAPVTDETVITTGLTTPSETNEPLPPIQNPEFQNTPKGGIGISTEQYDYTEGENTILRVTCVLPVANVEGDETLQATLTDSLANVENELRSEVDQIYKQYLRDYQAGNSGLTTPSVLIRFDLHYFTADAVSMTYIITETTWDGQVYIRSYHSNLDLRVGSKIELSALLQDGITDEVVKLFTQKLSTLAPEGLYADAAELLSEDLSNAWYLEKGSLSVQLPAGKIAPLSSGDIILTLSKDEIVGVLSEYGKALL